MHLYMMRHGEAGNHFVGSDDSLRPLTEDGKAKLRIQAAALRSWNIKIGLIVSSPYTRARQTADIIAAEYGLPVYEDKRLAAGKFDSSKLGELLGEHADARLLITGHEPDFSTVLSNVVGGGRFEFSKGAVAHVKIDHSHLSAGTLQWFATPALMGAT